MAINTVLLVIATFIILIIWTIAGHQQRRKATARTEAPVMLKSAPQASADEPAAAESGKAKSLPAPAQSLQAIYAMPMRIIISAVILGAALYIILSQRYEADSKNWAFGVAGTIIGYWFKNEPGEKNEK